MAMLAEPRRKQRVINLRAKNNAWSNDSSKFGQRMLEKMGWTSGKGLGANENGITEHVIARYKNDERGLGFEDKNDQWTKHEDDFNSLLANLSNANDKTENLHSGISLEDKSKKSKARIHYHKFTRGKDISRYSEKDLANIFGKKSFKNTEEAQVPLKQALKTREQIFTEKGSMEDYFKNKLAEFKSKSKFKAPVVNESHQEYDEVSYAFRGFAQDNDTTEFSNEIEYNQENKSNINYVPCDLDNLKSKKKKSKKPGNDDTNGNELENSCNTEQHIIHHHDEDIERKSKKKKLKNKMQVVDNTEEVCKLQESTQEKNKKKKSKNKDKVVEINVEESLPDSANCHDISVQNGDTDQIFKNKKSKKDSNKDFSSNTQIDDANVKQNKKKKSSKNKDFCEDNLISHDIVKKKKSKRKNDQNVVDVAQDLVSGTEYLPKKKKKRKCKEN